jgi:ribonuclease R
LARKPSKDDGLAGKLPTKAAILEFVRASDEKVGKREIARAFSIKGGDRVGLKRLLKEMDEEGLLDYRKAAPPKKTRNGRKGEMPAVAVIDIADRDTDGELLGKPAKWEGEGSPPVIMLAPGEGASGVGGAALGIGDRVLARLAQIELGLYEARVIKRLGQSAHRILGVYRRLENGDGRVEPVDRKSRFELVVLKADSKDARNGELVLVEPMAGKHGRGTRARVRDRLGNLNEPKAVSLIAIHAHGIPTEFPPEAIEQAENATMPSLSGRTDLRDMPLITIDPEDARDYDDAIHAEPDSDPKNKGGWIVTVAIADVAHFVEPGSALDQEGRKRGNSTYFPDRVVPMLPEALSNELCSLKPKINRACLAVRMRFNRSGRKIGHEFLRGIMRSAARLTYEQAQAAIDGRPDDTTGPILEDVLRPIWDAYEVLAAGRRARNPLDLELPEYRIDLGESGVVQRVYVKERLDAHKLIEEFMIQANVSAAEALEERKVPLLYRIHEPPSPEKLAGLQDFLASLDIKLSRGDRPRPEHFNRILHQVRGTEHADMVNEVILRSQSQAYYGPNNHGHFGLNLPRYAHFTSPIRRYADIVVHRALIRAFDLGKDGLTDAEIAGLEETGEHISGTERRSMAAERDSTDRYMATYLADRVGATFQGRITGVTRFGLFIRLAETGGDGIVPISSLGNEYFVHDETLHALIGERSGAAYRLGDPVEVKLLEAAPVTGGLRFELISDALRTTKSLRPGGRPKRGPRGRMKSKSPARGRRKSR